MRNPMLEKNKEYFAWKNNADCFKLVVVTVFEKNCWLPNLCKKQRLKVQMVEKNMSCSVNIMVWLEEHWAFIVECFIKTKSCVTATCIL